MIILRATFASFIVLVILGILDCGLGIGGSQKDINRGRSAIVLIKVEQIDWFFAGEDVFLRLILAFRRENAYLVLEEFRIFKIEFDFCFIFNLLLLLFRWMFTAEFTYFLTLPDFFSRFFCFSLNEMIEYFNAVLQIF